MGQEKITSSIRITPLNLVSAMALIFGVLLAFDALKFFQAPNPAMRWIMVVLCALIVVVTFFSDMLFRKTFRSLGKIWVVELAMLVLTFITLLFIKSIF